MKIKIDKQNELVAVLDQNSVDSDEKDEIIDLMNQLNLFANGDSWNMTETYIQKNNIILEKLIDMGVKDLYYNICMIAAADRLHFFIKDKFIKDPIVLW